MFHALIRRSLLLAACVLLAACGGGSGDGGAANSTAPPTALALPTLRIDTGNTTIVRDVYIDATYVLADSAGTTLSSGPLEIRGRGRSTWGFDKKPYRIALDQAAGWLGMPSSRHWVLLANHADKTLLRNEVTFELGRLLGMAWTPRSQQVHLTLDGRYDGVYQITEHIRISSQRVNIDELEVTDTTAPAVTGGYLLEIDEGAGGPNCLRTRVALMTICGDDPDSFGEPAWEPQRSYIFGYLQATEDALYAPNFADPQSGYAAYLDVESVIQYYLANELVKNVDGNLRRSTYLHKKRNGKLFFGPLWDFDLAIGNATYFGGSDAQGWYIRTAPWYARLFEDPAFSAAVAARWRALKTGGQLDALLAYVDRRVIEIDLAQARNFERWPIMDTNIFANVMWPPPNSYANEARYLREFLVRRIEWMDQQFTQP